MHGHDKGHNTTYFNIDLNSYKQWLKFKAEFNVNVRETTSD